MKLTDEQIEEIYQSFDCLIPKSLIKKVLKNKIYVVGYVLLTSHIKKAN